MPKQAALALVEDRAALPVRNRMSLLFAIMAVSICQFLDATIANVALPHMQASLGASIDSVSWVLTSFIIAAAIFTPLTGWLADRIGSRNLFIGATGLFLLSSALCGAATSLPAIVVFRAVQGAASAMMGPLSQSIILDINPPSKQTSAMTMWGAASMIAPISGPFLGGFLTDELNWRWVYYVNLPIGIPAIMVLYMFLPSRPKVDRPLDLYGFGLIGLGLGTLQLMLDRGQQQDWLQSWEIIIEGIVAISCLWMFMVRSRLIAHPLFNPMIYRDPNFIAGLGFGVVMGVINIAFSATLPSMFQNIYGFPVMTAGLLMAPRGIGMAISMIPTAWLSRRVDFRVLICAGLLMQAFSMWEMSQWALVMGFGPIIVSGVVQGMGLGMMFAPISLLAFSTLQPGMRTEASSLLGLFRSLGGSFGITAIVTMVTRATQQTHGELGAHVTSNMVPGVDISGLAAMGGGAVLAMVNGEVSRQAAMIAYLQNYQMMTVILLCLAPVPFFLKGANVSAMPGK